ncbi:putative L-pipecolate oxidase [[Candida] jaroonii]|uniref:L-pipecolate oxidase n=1 Tax=[Candida] jaroonii TaxID=467808 RepID=A0ACA9Y6A0_9ASCO|nr:putative L-pipecolate oxidase [[Candida] jaroonii]
MNVKQEEIVIVGAGTFGLSTGLWLLRNGFKNVTLVDPYEVPSEISAGYDINKIVQSSYQEDHCLTNSLAIEALEGWQTDPVFFPHFHETGILYSTSQGTDSSEYKELLDVKSYCEKTNRRFKCVLMNKSDDFKKIVPQLTGPLKKWKGFFQPAECGWAHARDTLVSAGREISRLGGRFVVGEVSELIYGDSSVTGCLLSNGESILADKIIISAGASSVKLLKFQNQLLAKCWTVAHIKLSKDEAKKFKNMPVVLNYEQGFFFEPDPIKNELKICNEFPGYTNYVSGDEPDNSIPLYKSQIPKAAELDIRKLLSDTLPEFKDREFVETKICWCTDTPDRNFLICEHPDFNSSLILATGDSGHGFKHMPIIGKYIARLVTYGPIALDEEKRNKWKWRPETSKDRVQDRFGGDGHVGDLHDISNWVSKVL